MTDLADEIKKLNELVQSGSLTNDEFTTAKARLLANPTITTNVDLSSVLQDQLADLHYQNELARIDREWEIERRQYEIVGRSGRAFVPTLGTGLFTMLVGGIFGAFLIGVALTAQSVTSHFGYENPTILIGETIFLWFAAFVTISAVGSGLYRCVLAQNQKTAYRAYQARRRNLDMSVRNDAPG